MSCVHAPERRSRCHASSSTSPDWIPVEPTRHHEAVSVGVEGQPRAAPAGGHVAGGHHLAPRLGHRVEAPHVAVEAAPRLGAARAGHHEERAPVGERDERVVVAPARARRVEHHPRGGGRVVAPDARREARRHAAAAEEVQRAARSRDHAIAQPMTPGGVVGTATCDHAPPAHRPRLRGRLGGVAAADHEERLRRRGGSPRSRSSGAGRHPWWSPVRSSGRRCGRRSARGRSTPNRRPPR